MAAAERVNGSIPAAVVVAHPGHELRIFHWMEQHRPVYFCLTEGSGGAATSRVGSTERLLDAVGATQGPILGLYSDKAMYQMLLQQRTEEWVRLAQELAGALIAAGIDLVAGDAIEGFNPVHDACRFVIDGAVAMAQARTGRPMVNLDFTLDSAPDSCPDAVRDRATWLRLDEAALSRKIAAAEGYPELREEVQFALGRFGRSAFGVECLRPSTTALMLPAFDRVLPAYERYGQMRVNEGRYHEVIRYRSHVLPVRHAISAATPAEGSQI